MAVTITNVKTPNSQATYGEMSGLKSVIVDVTFDSSYVTGGEVVTAANLGWTNIIGGIVMSNPAPSGNASALASRIIPNSAQTQVAIQLFQSGYDPTTAFSFAAPAVGTAGNDLNTNAFVAPFAGNITAVSYVPITTLTGANTNTRSVTLSNLTRTLVPATIQYNSGVNATLGVANAVTLGNAANVAVLAGDVFQWQSTHVGSGLADPGGMVSVTITPTLVPISFKELASATNAATLTGRYILLGN